MLYYLFGKHCEKKKKSKNVPGFPSHELADDCECIMPVSEGQAKVTDRARPAGPKPDQLYIVSICVSVRPRRPPLDEMQADGGGGGGGGVEEGVSYN